MANILFPDHFVITQVAAARALGRRGDSCDVAWPYGSLKRRLKSRFVGRVHPTARLSTDPDRFAEDVLRLCRDGAYDVLLPVSIESTEALLPYKDELDSHVGTLLPTREQLSVGADKTQTVQLCKNLQIAHPETWFVRERKELDQVCARTNYPVVIKHPRNLGGSRGVRFAGNEDELVAGFSGLQDLNAGGASLLVQEYVPGLLFDAVTVARDGSCPRIFTSARKLMYPISGGVTCISVSTRTPELKKLAATIVAALNWTGPVEMEFKLDSRDGKFKLIEINPRFWASLGTSIECGVNFPAIAVDLAMGRDVPQVAEHEVGVCHKYMIGRVPYAYWQLARARGLKAIRDPQRYRRVTYDMDFADPVPDLFAMLSLARNLITGKFPKPLTQGAQQMIQALETAVPYA